VLKTQDAIPAGAFICNAPTESDVTVLGQPAPAPILANFIAPACASTVLLEEASDGSQQFVASAALAARTVLNARCVSFHGSKASLHFFGASGSQASLGWWRGSFADHVIHNVPNAQANYTLCGCAARDERCDNVWHEDRNLVRAMEFKSRDYKAHADGVAEILPTTSLSAI
jgi:hypothetical protein